MQEKHDFSKNSTPDRAKIPQKSGMLKLVLFRFSAKNEKWTSLYFSLLVHPW
jgi:hypothetical protein